MKLSNISKYRTQLMGIATVFIILCHTTLELRGVSSAVYRLCIKQFLQCGVDVFLLLSGLGCYFSYAKNKDVVLFYKKRYLRVLVPYLIVYFVFGAVSVLLLHTGVFRYAYNYSVFSFYLSGYLSVWFVSAIMAFYLFFPLVYRFVQLNIKWIILVMIIIIGVLCVPFWKDLPRSVPVVREICLIRIPIFIFGALIGKRLFEKREVIVHKAGCIIVFVAAVGLFVLVSIFDKADTWLHLRLLFIPITLCLTCLVSHFFEKIDVQNSKSNGILVFMGTISFEAYLIFERVLLTLQEQIKWKTVSNTLGSVIVNVSAIAITLLLGWLVNRLAKKLTAIIRPKLGITA